MDVSQLGPDPDCAAELLSKDGGRVLSRMWRRNGDGVSFAVLTVLPEAEHPTPASLERLAHEHELRDELDPDWALRPLALEQVGGRTTLLLEDSGGAPLDGLTGAPMQVAQFLRLAVGIASALGKAHQRGLLHKDIKSSNILVNRATGEVRLTGFGIASRLPRERPLLEPLEVISGSLAYMAPEQTGRMNRSVDARSDLYAVGVTLYEVFTGSLPFTAVDAIEWVHCHIARKPAPPAERRTDAPGPISAIIMRLLAKTPEERYQTAIGLEHDLRRCLAEWEAHGRIDDFVLGLNDRPDRLVIPEALYGREVEVEALGATFDAVAAGSAPQLVLLSGPPGVGKSAVVHELHRTLALGRGLFASGKCDAHQRNVPYAALALALRSLIGPLLGKSDAELVPWREAVQEALGQNGQLVSALLPELEPLIGPQPPAPELPPQEAQRRSLSVFRRLLGVFARPEHPLALFLDDLQWLDLATLDLLEHLAGQSDLPHLLLIGAYRDNDVTPSHPLIGCLAAIRAGGGQIREIALSPLKRADVNRLIADALQCAADGVTPLASLVHAKSGGNPFFTIQFLTALADERLLSFDHLQGCWAWDLDRIEAKGFTDNVLELVLSKLHRLPDATQRALRELACLGGSAPITTLATVNERDEPALQVVLWEALQAGLVLRQANLYRFPHDRVREAAYELIPPAERPSAHLAIGRMLEAGASPARLQDAVFEIVGHYNRAESLITSLVERDHVAELNLMAGRRAQAALAYASALAHFEAGAALLQQDAWARRQGLAFDLELHRAECEFWTSAWAAAEPRLSALADRAVDMAQRAAVAGLRMDLCMGRGAGEQAVAVGLEALRHVGIDWAAHPSEVDAVHEYESIWPLLSSRTIEVLASVPPIRDPEARAIFDLLTLLGPPALYTDANLFALTICRAANLSLELGGNDAAPVHYATLGLIASSRFDDAATGYQFGKVACDLLERGFDRFAGRTYVVFQRIVPWTRPVRESIEPARRAHRLCSEAGDLTYAGFANHCLLTSMLAAAHPLAEVEREARDGVDFARSVGFDFAVDHMAPPLALVRSLRGETRFGRLDDGDFSEVAFEARAGTNPALVIPACFYWILKLQARLLAGDTAAAMEAAERAGALLAISPALPAYILERADYHLYAALACAAACEAAGVASAGVPLSKLQAHLSQLQAWAATCPENFEARAAMVTAEVARLEGRPLDAEHLYETAIAAARLNGFAHHEALACELAGRFYLARGLGTAARAYLGEARRAYLSWGADGKVRQLDGLYPQLVTEALAADPSGTIAAPVEHLDLATVLNLSRAISGEMVLDRLIQTLMRIALEHAGAQRGLLILLHAREPRIAAEATCTDESLAVSLLDAPVTATALPQAILHYVQRTGEIVVLPDATQSQFAQDPYIAQGKARSILAMPLLTQANLVGVLFLENELAAGVFAPDLIAVLKLLTSQAAIALENSRLYADLAEREARIRRLVDANIVGVIVWGPEGQLIEANEAFLTIVGYGREDLASGRLRWQDLTPPEWLEVHETWWGPKFMAAGSLGPFEQECLRKDGSRAPVLIGSAAFEQGQSEGVAFVLDLTDLRRAEAQAREREQLLRNVQAELAHANRVATTGHLAGSIAHDVNQPVHAARIGAAAAVRWLSADPPDIEEAKLSLAGIVKSCRRAGEIIEGMRALVKKDTARIGPVVLNAAVAEIVALTRNEAERYGVELRTQLADDLPPIEGDRVQLQQVILNLVINALQAMSGVDEPRALLISTEATKDGVVAAVEDSGLGFSEEQAKHLFDPFYTTKPSGLGLGLAICRTIADAHGGRLSATAKAPRGACFEFFLPTAPAARP